MCVCIFSFLCLVIVIQLSPAPAPSQRAGIIQSIALSATAPNPQAPVSTFTSHPLLLIISVFLICFFLFIPPFNLSEKNTDSYLRSQELISSVLLQPVDLNRPSILLLYLLQLLTFVFLNILCMFFSIQCNLEFIKRQIVLKRYNIHITSDKV